MMVIDLNDKFLPCITNTESLLKNCNWLIKVAKSVDIPVFAPFIQSISTSEELLDQGLTQAVVIGIESDANLIQTILNLQAIGLSVFVVEDCLGTISPDNKRLTLQRLKQANITVIGREMLVFEWLRKSNTHVFRYISRTFIT